MRVPLPHDQPTPLGARGLWAGAAGTFAMTRYQVAVAKIRGTEPSTTPAEVGKRVIRGVFHRRFPEEHTAKLNQAMHWGYARGARARRLLPPGLRAHGRRGLRVASLARLKTVGFVGSCPCPPGGIGRPRRCRPLLLGLASIAGTIPTLGVLLCHRGAAFECPRGSPQDRGQLSSTLHHLRSGVAGDHGGALR